MSRILIVEPEHACREVIGKQLTAESYTVTLVENNHEMFWALEQNPDYAAIVGDLGRLEAETTTLHRLAAHYSTIPVIVTLSQATANTVIEGMRAGVFDVFIKPFAMEALLLSLKNAIQARRLRLRARLLLSEAPDRSTALPGFSLRNLFNGVSRSPRPSHEAERWIHIGSLNLDQQRRTANYRGAPLELTPTEFDILVILAQRAGQVILFQDLVYRLQNIQLPREDARKMLSAHMSNLRAKLREVGCEQYLVNSRGRGYSLDAPGWMGRSAGAFNPATEPMSAPGIFWSTDRQLRFLAVWGGRLPALKLQADELIGTSLYDLARTDATMTPIVQVHQRALSGEAVTYEANWRNHRFRARVEPIYDPDRNIIGCTGVSLDVKTPDDARQTHFRDESSLNIG